MNKYRINFSGTWAGNPWSLANVVYYNDADEVVTDTAFATQYTMPEGVTTFNNETGFVGCYELRHIEVPNGVEIFDAYAFADCMYMKTIIIPNSVTTINYDAFNRCYDLTFIYTNADNIENLKTIMGVNYTSYVDSIKETPRITKSIQPSYPNGDIISYVTSIESVYTTEYTPQGKSKTLEVKLTEFNLQKQDKLVSGMSIKTINGESVLGYGDIEIGGGGVDSVNGQTGAVALDAEDVGAYTKSEVDTLLTNTPTIVLVGEVDRITI